MGIDIDPVFLLIVGIIILIVLIADFVIFCYWFSFKYKEYSFQQAYGPILKFPPRNAGREFSIEAEIPIPNTHYQIPNAEHPTPNEENLAPTAQYPIPNTQYRVPPTFAPPEFDFLPPAKSEREQGEIATDEGAIWVHGGQRELRVQADVSTRLSETDQTSTSGEVEVLAETPPQPNVDESDISESVLDYPALAVDPLEDIRPADPTLLAAIGGLRSPFASTWSLVHPFVGFQVILVVINVFSTLFLIPLFPRLMAQDDTVWTTPYALSIVIISLMIQNVGFVGLTAYFLKGYGTSLKRIGLRMPSRREIALGLFYGAGLCIVAMLLEKGLGSGAEHALSKQFVDKMSKLNDKLSAGGMFEQIRSVPFQIGFIVAGAIAAPIGEEVFFRGLLFNSLKKRWGVTAGVIVSGICFGLIHFAPLSVIIIIPMGCVLALVYERTKSLWVTIIMHAVNNGVQLLLAMYAINHAAGH